jgi:hypothetical protein
MRGNTVAAGNASIAIGHLPEDHLTLAGAKQFAAPVPLSDFHPLIFGNGALDLCEQPRMRIVAGRLLEKDDAGPEAFEFLEDHNLIGVLSSQSIRTQDQRSIERASLGTIAQAVKTGAIETGAAVPIIHAHIVVDDVVLMVTSEVAKRVEL